MKLNLPITDREVELSEDAVLISTTDKKGIICYVNQWFIDISGYSKEELLGTNHNIVRHPDMPVEAFADMWDTLKTHQPWLGVVKNRCKDGSYYWVEAFVSPIYENGELSGYQSVRVRPQAQDVTRAIRLYQRLQKHHRLTSSPLDKLSMYTKVILALLITLFPLFLTGLYGGPTSNHGLNQLVGLISSLAVGSALFWKLTTRLRQLAVKGRGITENAVLPQVMLGTSDELGQIAAGLAMQTARLRTIQGRSDDAGNNLDKVATNMAMTAEIASLGMEEAKQEISQIVTAVTEMSNSIALVASSIKDAAQQANQTREETDKINLGISSTVGVISKLEDEINKTSARINDVQQDSINIGAVVDVIREIADQTNMLALNAAIEAARAGESGRGFAVVADEVRALATRTMQSTEEIQRMINGLQDGAKNAVETMQNSLESLALSVDNVAESAESIALVSESTRKISELNSSVATSAEQQNSVAQDINESIQNIFTSVSQVAHSAQTVKESSLKVTEMANRLSSALGKSNKRDRDDDNLQLDESTELF